MTRHTIVITACIVLCLGMCAGIVVQQRQIDDLRAEQQKQLAQVTVQPAVPTQASDSLPAPLGPPPGLLRLRSQVTQLAERKRALAGVRVENEGLRAALTNRSTNITTGPALPPGYIRKSEAQWVGMGSPESTLQSFLWAIQNHDLTNFIKTLTPETAAKFLADNHGSVEKMFEGSGVFPGMMLTSQKTQPDGSIKAKFEVMPGESMEGETIRFRQIHGEWKMDLH